VKVYDVVVVGGGPAGSTVAALAAKEGLSVLLLEAAAHPRVHVGESLLPGIIPILAKMGALKDVEQAGFTRKTGSTHWGWGLTPEWDLWFTDSEAYEHAWLVDRSRFDEILFRAAARAGVEALENAAVKSFLREDDRVVGVTYRRRGDDALLVARARFTVDASGSAALMARELGGRAMIQGLQHEASWAHFEGAGRLPPPRERQALFIATEGQWLWHFPLSDTHTSIGLIRLADDEQGDERAREQRFDAAVADNERLMAVVGPAARRVTPVRNLRDWSYRVGRVAGPGFFLAGDASGFIDPVLSTGVMLAMHAAWHAAALMGEVVKKGLSEDDARAKYQAQHERFFEDMLRIVRFFYQRHRFRDDYFWESKRILMNEDNELRPRKAFMILTSGLVRNLAYDETRAGLATRHAALTNEAHDALAHDPDRLGFVCMHLRWRRPDDDAALYFLVEPKDPSAPTLFQTINWHVNCLAPKLGNDPISVPALAPHLRALEAVVRDLDTRPGEALSAFWRRSRERLVGAARALPPELELVRIFGE
jgi:flavin-dependent dehydrogenase